MFKNSQNTLKLKCTILFPSHFVYFLLLAHTCIKIIFMFQKNITDFCFPVLARGTHFDKKKSYFNLPYDPK